MTTHGCEVIEGLHNQLMVVTCLGLLQLRQQLTCQLWLVIEKLAIVLLHGGSIIDALTRLSRVLTVTLLWLLIHGDRRGCHWCSRLGSFHLSISSLLAWSLNTLNMLRWERVLVRHTIAAVVLVLRLLSVEVQWGLLFLYLHLFFELPILELFLLQELFQDFCCLALISIWLAECLLDLILGGIWMQCLQKLILVSGVFATGIFITWVKIARFIGGLREEDVVIIGAEVLLLRHLLFAQHIWLIVLLLE